MKNILGHHNIDFLSNETLTCLWNHNRKDYGETWKKYFGRSNLPFSVKRNNFIFVAVFRAANLNQGYFSVRSDKGERYASWSWIANLLARKQYINNYQPEEPRQATVLTGRNHHQSSETATGTGCRDFSLLTISHYKGPCPLEGASSVSYTVTSQAVLKQQPAKKINETISLWCHFLQIGHLWKYVLCHPLKSPLSPANLIWKSTHFSVLPDTGNGSMSQTHVGL